MRTPAQIIGNDALTQLIFEGYAVVPTKPTDEMREQMAQIADGPSRSYDEYWSMMVNTASGQKAEESDVMPHQYKPSIMHMGDCAVCGHLQGTPIHSPFQRDRDK